MKRSIYKFLLFIGTPLTFLSALWLKLIVKYGTGKLEKQIFNQIGVLPVIDHYYQPLINPRKHLVRSLRTDRNLPGIDLNVDEQLALLSKFDYSVELTNFPLNKTHPHTFHYNNDSYGPGDAEYLYSMIRHFKPRRIIEIGSGASTLMAQNAVKTNGIKDAGYSCDHICIEPYEQPWLEELGVEVIRKRVETINIDNFQELEAHDILFIDSSHIIRPQGDVLFEYLEILPTLKSGVLIHIHDIFTPKDYKDEWVYNNVLWNEQYLLEAFLTFNEKFKVVAALNYLSHNFSKELAAKCPVYAGQTGCEPGAFWVMRK